MLQPRASAYNRVRYGRGLQQFGLNGIAAFICPWFDDSFLQLDPFNYLFQLDWQVDLISVQTGGLGQYNQQGMLYDP